nr:LysR family transcriptional regulator [Escherichia coli]
MLNSWPLAKDLQVLVEIVHSGSFSAAAATLGQTPAFVTKRIQILENGNDSNLLIVFYVQIMPDDFVMQLHRF